MRALIEKYIPNAPGLGLYLQPNIPKEKLRNALDDYAQTIQARDVVALYDATLLGSAKDGAVFTDDRIVFQNTDLHPAQELRYDDIVGVSVKKRFLGGMKLLVDHNAGQATVTHTIDFSGKGGAAQYVARFLQEAMLAGADEAEESAEGDPTDVPHRSSQTDRVSVEAALGGLIATGRLSRADYNKMIRALDE